MTTPPVIRSLARLQTMSSVIFGQNYVDFPATPIPGETVMKDGILWCWTTIGGFQTWYPLTNRKNSYVHTQSAPALQWSVNHRLGSANVVLAVYDSETNEQVNALITIIDADNLQVNFASATAGSVVVLADAELVTPAV